MFWYVLSKIIPVTLIFKLGGYHSMHTERIGGEGIEK